MKTINQFIKSAYENLIAKMPNYLKHLFGHALDGNGAGSEFNITSVGLGEILNGHWPVSGTPICWTDVTEKFKTVLLPDCFCYQTHDPIGSVHTIMAKPIDDFTDDQTVCIRKEEYNGENVYSIIMDVKGNDLTRHTNTITVIVQNDPDMGYVTACMHPGDPLPANKITECKFKDGDEITIKEAKTCGFTTVKLRVKV